MPSTPEIRLEPICHRNEDRIAFRYPYHTNSNNQVRRLPGVRWSQTHRCWHVATKETAFREAVDMLSPDCGKITASASKAIKDGRSHFAIAATQQYFPISGQQRLPLSAGG